MRFVKIPAILSTVPDLSCVVFRKRQSENRETISIVKQARNQGKQAVSPPLGTIWWK